MIETDVLIAGSSPTGAPLAALLGKAGDVTRIEIDKIGAIEATVIPEQP